jgi:Cytochrome P460
MRKYLPATIIGIALMALTFVLPDTRPIAAQNQKSTAVFDSDGKLELPTGYRRWIFVGAPLTPNGLNNGKAGFPEYHHVYVEERNVDAYLKTGRFRKGPLLIRRFQTALVRSHPGVGFQRRVQRHRRNRERQ